ncbi:hypothetical protein HDU91_002637, partial [Kappamyces sp. JEL0680]
NNGGDALVAARHLKLFGWNPLVWMPKRLDRFAHLIRQLEMFEIPVSSTAPPAPADGFAYILDGLFGFSFRPPVRPDFEPIMAFLDATKIPIISIDIPSGWDVEQGNVHRHFTPAALVSLTAPKLGASHFAGQHYVSGRFVPPALAAKYQLSLPVYPSGQQFVKLVRALI